MSQSLDGKSTLLQVRNPSYDRDRETSASRNGPAGNLECGTKPNPHSRKPKSMMSLRPSPSGSSMLASPSGDCGCRGGCGALRYAPPLVRKSFISPRSTMAQVEKDRLVECWMRAQWHSMAQITADKSFFRRSDDQLINSIRMT